MVSNSICGQIYSNDLPVECCSKIVIGYSSKIFGKLTKNDKQITFNNLNFALSVTLTIVPIFLSKIK